MDINNSVKTGISNSQDVIDNARKNAAFNALNAVYGDISGDPDAAVKMQEYGQREKLNPIAVDQAKAALTGTTQENEFNALNNPIKLQQGAANVANTQATTANTQANTDRTTQLLPGEVSQQGATLAQTRAQTNLTNASTANTNAETAQKRFTLNTQQGAQDRASAMGILAALSDTASAGGDVGGKFDELAPLIAQYEGVSQDHMAGLRAAMVKDPVGTINKLSTAVQAAQLSAMGGKTGAAGALQMLKFGQQQMSLKDGLNFTQQRTAAVPGLADQMLALVPRMSSVATVRKAKAEIPGTPEYQFDQMVEQLKPNLSLDDLRTLKASGLSLGRVSNMEMGMSGNAIANMDLGQNPATLTANLKRIQGTYKIVNDNLGADISRIGGTSGMGVKPATTPQYQTGAVYKDKNGNTATWDGTKFVPTK